MAITYQCHDRFPVGSDAKGDRYLLRQAPDGTRRGGIILHTTHGATITKSLLLGQSIGQELAVRPTGRRWRSKRIRRRRKSRKAYVRDEEDSQSSHTSSGARPSASSYISDPASPKIN
jgi:hypothetical protein